MSSEPRGVSQTDIDAQNAAFWDEMCGSQAARSIGVTGNDLGSLARFDRWFFQFYPYLDRFIDFADVSNKDVFEVGLGFGSVSQRLAENGARLTCLDIAAGPVAGVNHRLGQLGLSGTVIQGSILKAPLEDVSFDVVIAIGCYHHTGNLTRAIGETARLLRPGGRATIMVYNATSYLRWIRNRDRTWRYVRDVANGDPPPMPLTAHGERGDFDRDTAGEAAPETVLVSKTHFARLLKRQFSTVEVWRTNAGSHRPFHFLPRGVVLATIGPILGLDLYARVVK